MNKIAERLENLTPAKRKLLEQVLKRGKPVAVPIAICGVGCRFPGAPSPDTYWQLLMGKEDAIQEVPASRWDIDEFYDPTGQLPGKISTRWGGFLDDVDQFDPLFFGLSPREAEKIDPQQRLLLEVAWEALEDGGISAEELGGTKTGVFLGIGGVDYSRIPAQLEDHYQQISVHSGTGNALSIAANRLSYLLDLRGPSLIVDTACSSSLVALHLAMRSLRSRESEAALVGGVNLILTPETSVAFSKARMLSPTGQCRPFDARANGYVRSEGCGIVVLKRLADAVAAGDRVLAVLRGSAVNQDGRTAGITAPNSLSQEAVLRAALADAGLSANQISYLEAHGTGTPLGDPIEWEALRALFVRKSAGDPPCHFGSVKANIGHAETAAGIASLVKVILMLQHGQIPGQAHLEQLNPHLSLQGTRLEISQQPTPWAATGTRRAGISAFGFGGTNAHVIVEQAKEATGRSTVPERPYHLLTLSGKSAAGLGQLAKRYDQFVESKPDVSLADLCHTANTGRTHFQHRLAIGAANLDQLHQRLKTVGRKKTASSVKQGVLGATHRLKVAYLFTGQGSQYVGMGRELFQLPGVFRDTLLQCDQILRDLRDESLLTLLFAPQQAGDRQAGALDETINTQPALFALEYALARLWESWGMEPEILLGHSIGEYAAACFAGVFSLEDGMRLVVHRGRLMQQLAQDGLMAVVFAPLQAVLPIITSAADQVSIAASNGPDNTVISGFAPQVRELCDRFQRDGFRTQTLTVSHAFHSPLMDPILEPFEQLAKEIEYQAPRIPIVSNLTGRVLDETPPDARYWRAHIRQPVLFAEGVSQLAACQPDAVLEMGPAATLLGMARRAASELQTAWLPSLRKGQNDWHTLLASLSELYVRGAKVDWRGLDRPWPRRPVRLPTYPFQRRALWYDLSQRRTAQLPGSGHDKSVHPLLGWQVPAAVSQTLYENRLSATCPSYLEDHQVQGSVIVPAAAYLEQSLAAADQRFGKGLHLVENISVQQALILTEENPRAVQLTLGPESEGQCVLEIYSRAAEPSAAENSAAGSTQTGSSAAGNGWTLHACGSCRPVRGAEASQRPERIPLEEIRARLYDTESQPDTKSKASFYHEMAQRGLVYGPAFQVLGELARGESDALARVELPESIVKQLAEYRLHPALLDGCFQALAGVVPKMADGTDSPDTYVPTFIRHLRLHRQPAGRMWIHAVRTPAGVPANMHTVKGHTVKGDVVKGETVEGDVRLLNASGEVMAELLGVRVQRIGRGGTEMSPRDHRDWSYKLSWQEDPLPSSLDGENKSAHVEPTGRLIFSDRKGIGAALAALPGYRSAHDVLVYPGSRFRQERCEENPNLECYQIDPCSADDYRRLFDQLQQQTSLQTCAVIHLWSCDLESRDLALPAPNRSGPHGAGPNGANSSAKDPATMTAALELSSPLVCDSALPMIQQLARFSSANNFSLTLVTRGAQALASDLPESDKLKLKGGPENIGSKTPRAIAQAPLWGLGRVAAMELPELQVRLLDLDPAADAVSAARSLTRELRNRSPENQVAYRGSTRYVARLQRDPEPFAAPEQETGTASPPAGPFRLRLTTPGKFSALRYEPLTRKPPGPDQVEIEVHSTGLNFSDVLKAMGLYPGIQDEVVPLGIECAGVVTAVGDRIDRFAVGDPVLGVAPYSFASHALTAPYALVKTPDGISADQACTIPIAFLTAHYALCHLAHLQPEEKVLIHAGAGGVGQAAIQIAQAIGAEIFTTAGSPEKRDFLRAQGIEHVMNSRTLDFAAEILAATDRQGVDCVLNSLPGEAIAKSLSVLAAYGRFLEIGKIDIYQNRMLGLLPFQDNLSYFAIDLDRLLRQRPQVVQKMFARLMPFFERGEYRPLPLTRFPASKTVDAFRYMAQRKNIGKVVVALQDRIQEPQRTGRPEQPGQARHLFRPDATILITGGLGALGLRVARWLATQGTSHIVLLSRHKPASGISPMLDALRESDAQVTVVTGDVTAADSLATALKQIPASYPPLRGVFHAAGVLADGSLLEMDQEQLDRAMGPKVQGAWNLHTALRDVPLEHFVLFSSVATLFGSPGQANYAAGNAFLDALACFRRQQGLAACSIQWGPWAESGMAARGDLGKQVAARGLQPLDPDLALEALGAILAKKRSQAIVMDVRWDNLLSRLPGVRPPLLENFSTRKKEPGNAQPDAAAEADERDEEFCQQLQQADPGQRTVLLRDYIAETVASIMEIDLENLAVDQPLNTMGLDSLMGMELKAMLESQLGMNLPMASLLDNPTVAKLADLAGQNFAATMVSPEETRASLQEEAETVAMPAAVSENFSPLVALARGGTGPPLFCIHPIGGDIRCYFELANQFQGDRPIWALRPRGLDRLSDPHRSMDALVSNYLNAIRQVQPAGPWNLVGWSTGGIFALAMARRLQQLKNGPGALIFLDTPTPAIFQNVDLNDDARFLYDLVNFSNWFAGTNMRVSYQQLHGQDREVSLRTVLQTAKEQGVLPADTPVEHLRRIIEVSRENVRLLMQYEPEPLRQPVHLIRPRETGVLAEAAAQSLEHDLGWGPILAERLQQHEVPGDHFSMMVGENAQHLAKMLVACLG